MNFRFARHTNNLEKLTLFYTDILGLKILGSFENHDGYNGIFIGKVNADWHLEFTQTAETVIHSKDEDAILVFYPTSKREYEIILGKIENQK